MTPAPIRANVSFTRRPFLARQVDGADDTADYAATQTLAELFRDAGYDGVLYKSVLGGEGFNIGLFDLEAAELLNCGLYEVYGVSYRFEQSDQPYFVKRKRGDVA